MARIKLTHMKNKTQTLENKLKRSYAKGVDVPKVFIDNIRMFHMRRSEINVYLALIDNRDCNEDCDTLPTVTISYTDLTDYIGIYSKETVREAIKRLEDKKLIKADHRCLTNIYTLKGFKIKKFEDEYGFKYNDGETLKWMYGDKKNWPKLTPDNRLKGSPKPCI